MCSLMFQNRIKRKFRILVYKCNFIKQKINGSNTGYIKSNGSRKPKLYDMSFKYFVGNKHLAYVRKFNNNN